MDGPSALILLVLATFGPNGHVLLPALAPQGESRGLPVDAFLTLTPLLWVVFHEVPELPMAAYQEGASAPDLALHFLAADPKTERPLPRLRVPRLFLYAPYYRRGAQLDAAGDMPLDVAQHFFSALIEALFDLAPPAGVDQRAAEHGAALPATARRTAYVSAAAEFGSHALSVATELSRSLERQRTAGKDPCRLVDHPATLFGLWRRVFTTNEYRGQYPADDSGRRRWVQGPPLSPGDREHFARQVLGGSWSGDVRRDFALDCP